MFGLHEQKGIPETRFTSDTRSLYLFSELSTVTSINVHESVANLDSAHQVSSLSLHDVGKYKRNMNVVSLN